jgi:two-component system NtrC family response regulator
LAFAILPRKYNTFVIYLTIAILAKVLIIDDEEKLRSLLARIISLEGFEVMQAGDCKSALRNLEKGEFDLILCDVKLPDGNGVDFAKKIKEKYPILEIILLTAYGNINDGVQAIKNGAFDYITKGDDNNKIIPLIYRALEKVELAKRVQKLEKQLGLKYSFDNIISKSKSIQTAIELAKKVAITDTSVLLTGETGTGKEVFAQAIHQASARSKNNFVAINCAAFSKELLESEMFGHKAGSFTGASKDQKGLFEEANNGTIFLDEIGEMMPELQAKLLRVLETGEFIRVGDTKPTKINVRIIAATNRNLLKEIELGHFREDLFYRVSVFQIKLPSLGERIPDIEPLTNLLSQSICH